MKRIILSAVMLALYVQSPEQNPANSQEAKMNVFVSKS